MTSRRIGAPPSTVWDALAELDRIVDWAPDVEHSSMFNDRAPGVGAARRVQVGSMTLIETVTRWDEGTALAYTIDGLPPVVSRVETTWTLAPDGDGTLVSVTSDVTPGPRPPMRLAAKAVARRFTSANQKLLDGLAALVEARAREAAAS